MTSTEYESVKKTVKKYWSRWHQPLGLADWKIGISFSDGRGVSRREGYEVAATCDADWSYRSADVTFYIGSLHGKDDEEIESIVVHEMMHIFVNEMREEGIKHEERVCESLTWAFIWARETGEGKRNKYGIRIKENKNGK